MKNVQKLKNNQKLKANRIINFNTLKSIYNEYFHTITKSGILGVGGTQKLMWKPVSKQLQDSAHFIPIQAVINEPHYQ